MQRAIKPERALSPSAAKTMSLLLFPRIVNAPFAAGSHRQVARFSFIDGEKRRRYTLRK
ncbi:hypothetical protein IE992_30940 [Klebsiella pneumoniae]|uniref:Uncharacterized protein n=1 Tax=Klebsiella pneumoniae TaxID=573 RepID=A0A927DZP8_KLEPN|nr:hypothetical protein [Klebsiella pneumoniae]